jgi:hypothetical protein
MKVSGLTPTCAWPLVVSGTSLLASKFDNKAIAVMPLPPHFPLEAEEGCAQHHPPNRCRRSCLRTANAGGPTRVPISGENNKHWKRREMNCRSLWLFRPRDKRPARSMAKNAPDNSSIGTNGHNDEGKLSLLQPIVSTIACAGLR